MIITVDGSLFSRNKVEHFSGHHIFLLHVNMVHNYMIIILSCIATIVVHISIASVALTFVSSYTLSLLPVVLP